VPVTLVEYVSPFRFRCISASSSGVIARASTSPGPASGKTAAGISASDSSMVQCVCRLCLFPSFLGAGLTVVGDDGKSEMW
jgi:hypothetical protein